MRKHLKRILAMIMALSMTLAFAVTGCAAVEDTGKPAENLSVTNTSFSDVPLESGKWNGFGVIGFLLSRRLFPDLLQKRLSRW